eukprot:TRINITY_DN714_c0_g1_i2.p1 TRINITY_DN714_c0_g1~~TRINITY_DN714_c0_g1_i2.p1  ORF type:complete len:167 (+),score=21.53 TRINITY_DN714_c0_g1_i2:72-503(+)
MKNLAVADNGADIIDFASQYVHESRCLNLLNRDMSLVWFTHVAEPLPQHVTFELAGMANVSKLGIYLHGESNQNPSHIQIYHSEDNENWTQEIDTDIEFRAGDHLYDLEKEVQAKYVKFVVTENHGGSGIYISKCYVFGEIDE